MQIETVAAQLLLCASEPSAPDGRTVCLSRAAEWLEMCLAPSTGGTQRSAAVFRAVKPVSLRRLTILDSVVMEHVDAGSNERPLEFALAESRDDGWKLPLQLFGRLHSYFGRPAAGDNWRLQIHPGGPDGISFVATSRPPFDPLETWHHRRQPLTLVTDHPPFRGAQDEAQAAAPLQIARRNRNARGRRGRHRMQGAPAGSVAGQNDVFVAQRPSFEHTTRGGHAACALRQGAADDDQGPRDDDDHDVDHPAFSMLPCGWNSLRSLVVGGHSVTSDQTVCNLAAHYWPNLKELRLHAVMLDWSHTHWAYLSKGMPMLTRIELVRIDVVGLPTAFLSEMPALTSVALEHLPLLGELPPGFCRDTPKLRDVSLVDLPSLTNIGDNAFANSGPIRILEIVDAPQLYEIGRNFARNAHLCALELSALPELNVIGEAFCAHTPHLCRAVVINVPRLIMLGLGAFEGTYVAGRYHPQTASTRRDDHLIFEQGNGLTLDAPALLELSPKFCDGTSWSRIEMSSHLRRMLNIGDDAFRNTTQRAFSSIQNTASCDSSVPAPLVAEGSLPPEGSFTVMSASSDVVRRGSEEEEGRDTMTRDVKEDTYYFEEAEEESSAEDDDYDDDEPEPNEPCSRASAAAATPATAQ